MNGEIGYRVIPKEYAEFGDEVLRAEKKEGVWAAIAVMIKFSSS